MEFGIGITEKCQVGQLLSLTQSLLILNVNVGLHSAYRINGFKHYVVPVKETLKTDSKDQNSTVQTFGLA